MSIPSLLAELRSRDVHLWIDGDRLRCGAPTGVLTPELRQQLTANKAALLEFLRNADALTRQQRAIVPLQPHGRRPPLFAIGGHNGDVFCFRTLARCLGPEQPFYGLQPPGTDSEGKPLESVEEIAAYFAEQIRIFHPDGPYLLTGFCAGGTVAFELAQQLRRTGATIGLVAMIACPHPRELRRLPRARRYLEDLGQRLRRHAPALLLPLAEQRRYLDAALQRHRAHKADQKLRQGDPLLAQSARVQRATLGALARYRPAYYPGSVHLFLPTEEWMNAGGLAARWRGIAARLEEHYGPAGSNRDDMLREIHGPAFAELFRRCLEGIRRP
ncbi:MAG TPA: thioesterase domain-containing protein [Rhodocyclaceae bacterium]|nr:thioesterase domain-containing protein [Rhodocyclaceae bacterium]